VNLSLFDPQDLFAATAAQVPADLTAFLSTIAGVTGAIVAIVGGLLVSRYIGIESEQQGVDRLLDDAISRQAIAHSRRYEAKRDYHRHLACEYFDHGDVAGAILAGWEADQLLKEFNCTLTAEGLQPYLDEAHIEAARAQSEVSAMVPPIVDGKEPDWTSVYWKAARAEMQRRPFRAFERIWETAFNHEKADRKREARKAASGSTGWPVMGGGSDFSKLLDMSPAPEIRAVRLEIDARRRADLRKEVERTEQKAENLDDEVARLALIRQSIAKPNGLLWIGLAILLGSTIAGIVLPVRVLAGASMMSREWLLNWFYVASFAPLAFMAMLAVDVSRKRRRH